MDKDIEEIFTLIDHMCNNNPDHNWKRIIDKIHELQHLRYKVESLNENERSR